MSILARFAEKNDLEKITDVHIKCFPDYFSTKLGKNLLKSFYGEYLKKFPELFVVAVDSDSNEIIGLTNGYVIGQNIRDEFIRKNFLRLLLRGIFLLLKLDSTAWGKALKFASPSRAENNCKPSDGEGDLLSICVLNSYRGSGASSLMVEKFEEGLKKLGIDTYYLSVFTTNSRARRFYEKCGFKVFCENDVEVKYIKKL